MSGRVERYGAVVGVNDDLVGRYRELHAAVWPEVLELIKQTNIDNYSIYLRKLADGRAGLSRWRSVVANGRSVPPGLKGRSAA